MVAADFALLSFAVLSAIGFETAQGRKCYTPRSLLITGLV